MPIDAKLFAHIENDPALSGTYDLESIPFVVTMQNLREYLGLLTKKADDSVRFLM